MNWEKVNSWIQTITGIAVLIGIVLVVLELQQNQEAAQSQLTSDGFGMLNQSHISMLGESAAEVLAKSCDAPETLTTADLIVLDHYFTDVALTRINRLYSLNRRGSFVSDEYWKSDLGQWNGIFSIPAGRAWFRSGQFSFPDEVRQFGEDVLADWKPAPCISADWKPLIMEETRHLQRLE